MRSNLHSGPAVIFVAVLIACGGCRRDEPPTPPQKPSVQPAVPPPAAVPIRLKPTEIPAPNAKPPASASVQKPAADADTRDAVGAPAYLPRTGDVSGWTKRDPITVVSAADLGRLMTAEHAQRIGRFNVRSAAACSYQLNLGSRDLVANVLAFEANTPADAYGLVTCSSSSPQTNPCGGLTRVDPGPPLRFHTWQGRVAIQASINGAGPEQIAELRRLVQHIVSRVQREDEPSLVHAFPQQGRLPGRFWLLRQLDSLPADALSISTPPDIEAMSRLLGLGAQTQMGVACYSVPGAKQPNTVWVVQYPSTDLAKQAYLKLNGQIAAGGNSVWQNTNVMPPKGPYLIGTWTAEEESLQYTMPKIAGLLPSV